MADAPQESVVTFDLLDTTLIDSNDILSNLTEDEQNEVENVVTLLEIAQEDSLKDFKNDTNLLRHKPVNNSELDC